MRRQAGCQQRLRVLDLRPQRQLQLPSFPQPQSERRFRTGQRHPRMPHAAQQLDGGQPVPANTLMNVRVRARINGVNGEFGPACRLKLNPAAAPAPDQVDGHPRQPVPELRATRQWGNRQLRACPPGWRRCQPLPVPLPIPAEGFDVTRSAPPTSCSSTGTGAAAAGRQDLRCGSWRPASTTVPPGARPLGDVCLLTIDNTPAKAAATRTSLLKHTAAELRMFPNPNRGDLLNLSLSAIEEGVNTVSVDIYDLIGKRMSARTIAVTDGIMNTVLDLNGELAAGMYLVNITAGETLYTERLVIQP